MQPMRPVHTSIVPGVALDTLDTLVKSDIDVLVMGPFLVEKNSAALSTV